MASIINSTDTGSGGLITTGDSSDELQLQTAETTAITITSGQQSAFIAGTASAPAVTTTGDLNTGVYFPAADNIGFATNGVIRGRWTTDGLCFGSDTAAANALDDYEEGTWTPSFTVVANCSALSLTSAWYIKIGGLVTYSMVGSITITSSNTKTAFTFTQVVAQSTLTDPQGGSALLEGPNPFPYAAGAVINSSIGNSEGFAAFGASAVDFNGASTFYITGCFKAA